jgi:hypothetical protein
MQFILHIALIWQFRTQGIIIYHSSEQILNSLGREIETYDSLLGEDEQERQFPVEFQVESNTVHFISYRGDTRHYLI